MQWKHNIYKNMQIPKGSQIVHQAFLLLNKLEGKCCESDPLRKIQIRKGVKVQPLSKYASDDDRHVYKARLRRKLKVKR